MADEVKAPQRFLKAAKSLLELADTFADLGILFQLLKKTPQGLKQVNEDVVGKIAPRMSKRQEHERAFAETLAKLEPGERLAIILYLMPLLHEEQQADVILHVCHAGHEVATKHLKEVVEIVGSDDDDTQRLRVEYLDSLNWLKGDPEEYPIVKLQEWANRRFENFGDLWQWIVENFPTLVDKIGETAVKANNQLDSWGLEMQEFARQGKPRPPVTPSLKKRSLMNWLEDKFV